METAIDIISFFGIIAFAVSGAMVAIKKRVDLFGVIVLSVITATGGGITRDIFLDRLPPIAFLDTGYITLAALTAIVVYSLARTHKDYYRKNTHTIDTVNNIFDALGLGAFVVMGTQSAIDCGFSGNAFFTVFVGVLTGIGGGFLRDIMVCEIPMILKRHFYALAALAGALAFYILYIMVFPYTLSVLISIGITFSLRMLATHYKWNLPPAL